MAVINLIGDTLPEPDAPANLAALADLTEALARTAPRGCAVRVVCARDTVITTSRSPRISSVKLPFGKSVLQRLWLTSAAAKPLDG